MVVALRLWPQHRADDRSRLAVRSDDRSTLAMIGELTFFQSKSGIARQGIWCWTLLMGRSRQLMHISARVALCS